MNRYNAKAKRWREKRKFERCLLSENKAWNNFRKAYKYKVPYERGAE